MVLFALSIIELRLVLQETTAEEGRRMVVWKCYCLGKATIIPTNLFFRIHCFLRHMKNCLGSFICLNIAECSVHMFSLSLGLGVTACCCSWLLPKHLICVVLCMSWCRVVLTSLLPLLAAIFEFCPTANLSKWGSSGLQILCLFNGWPWPSADCCAWSASFQVITMGLLVNMGNNGHVLAGE